MQIGNKLKELRVANGLTQEELATRSELTKGFISQVERDLTSPSVDSLFDILEALGTSASEFFSKDKNEKIIFNDGDYFEYEDPKLGYLINWIVPNAQKNMMEPTLISLKSGGLSKKVDPFEGEVLGYVLKGRIVLNYGDKKFELKKGETFYFEANRPHFLENKSSFESTVLWISAPPNF
ncbi:helix-turn-helix domain-containing protein [Peptoniphilus raoultii]|uniref:helix-turn-helix domain-containing protein n=1 Tax=Peptoniphilus raoultii TaxID=1776387 RepID=UPI0008D90FCC|nr:XRE family transcriptional regulator [Peptoniphilus raoultii]